MIGNMKKVIIVTNKKDEVYGELLSALIAMKDDKKDSDGNIQQYEAVIWTEEQYKNNRDQLGSSNKIIFIGNTKTTNPIGKNISYAADFYDYGIYYGYLANKALITVDAKVLANSKKLYDNFIENYSKFVTNAGKSYDETQKTERYFVYEDFVEEENKKRNSRVQKIKDFFGISKKEKNNNSEKELKNKDRFKKIKLLVPIFWPSKIIELSNSELIKSMSKIGIKEQQFRCAVLAFYLNSFKEFME